MTGFDTLKYVHSMQETALALEEQARDAGLYTKDCSRVHDAIARGNKSGVALLWDTAGRLEIVDLNNGSKHCAVKETDGNGVVVEHDFPSWTNEQRTEKHRDETKKIVEEAGSSYEQMGGETFQKAAAHSHERANAAGNNFPTQVHLGPERSVAKGPTRPATDAAKQKQMAADAKKFNEQQYARNTLIAQRMKEASDKMWKKGRIA